MEKLERILIWTGHIGLIIAAGTLFFLDELPTPYIGSGIFFTAVCSYTLGLSLSIYLDKRIESRKEAIAAAQSMGSILKPTLLACLCTVISISIVVVAISEYAKGLGVL